jgi:hypothetical protein
MNHPDEYFSEKACRRRHARGFFKVGFFQGIILGISFTIFYLPITKYNHKVKVSWILKK